MKLSALLSISIFLISISFSVDTLALQEPQATVIEGESVDYGYVGPGQTFTIKILPKVYDGDRFLGQWDKARAVSLPDGWTTVPSNTYDDPLVVTVVTDKFSPEGEYILLVEAEDELDQENIGGKFTFTLIVHLKHDVLEMQVEPTEQQVGAGQPARFTITLTNEGSAPDVFEVSSTGVRDWEFEREIYLSAGSSKSFVYEVVGNEEESYEVKFLAQSKSSPLTHKSKTVDLHILTNLLSDYKATSNGILLFPLIHVPIYSIAGLLGMLF